MGNFRNPKQPGTAALWGLAIWYDAIGSEAWLGPIWYDAIGSEAFGDNIGCVTTIFGDDIGCVTTVAL